jgi:hypothetical protein
VVFQTEKASIGPRQVYHLQTVEEVHRTCCKHLQWKADDNASLVLEKIRPVQCQKKASEAEMEHRIL